ncbi:hypothetical protein GCM10020331_043380 [Ectobacillus funiculus]
MTGDNTVGGQSGTQQSAATAASQQSNSSAANTNTQQTQNGTTNTQQDGGAPPSGGPQGGMGRNNGTSGLFGTGQAGPLRLFPKGVVRTGKLAASFRSICKCGIACGDPPSSEIY